MRQVSPIPRSGGLTERVEAVFAPDGPLARTVEGYEARAGQVRMAAAVADALQEGGILLAEAGTGTGKTLAYLVPAILNRHRVLVSTGTKNLQEQIFFKDLPVLQQALGVPFTATLMKGRGNLLCLHRFEQQRTSDALRAPADRYYLRVLERWAASTETGDRAELDDLPEDLALWKDIAASNENCIGSECPQHAQCFVTRMRQRAAESDVVIVNHHLLCADAALRQNAYGEVIPECHQAIIDEAHQLEDVATQYFGVSVSTYRFEELARDAAKAIGAADIERDAASELRQLMDRVVTRAAELFGTIERCRRADVSRPAEERVRIDSRWTDQFGDAAHLVERMLEALAAAIALLKDPGEDLAAIGRRAGELRDDVRFVTAACDRRFVYFLEARGRGIFLKASPIDVSAIVRELLFDRMQTTILTSATLAVDGTFTYVRERLGIRDAGEVRLPSEFDYASQSLLYLPRGMPDPRDASFGRAAAEEVQQILARSRGRAFVLFTSYATLREVEAVLAGTLDYPLLVQGTAPRSTLIREFRATPHAVLLATSSFWQGVDVVGEALSCVVIDKLPFVSPGDPVTAARIEAIREAGGEPFNDYQVPLAILTLQQGLGRLIRHRQDRGVLAILDPRVRTKGYGRRFLASMPPAPVVQDLAAVERFFSAEGSVSAVS